MKYLRRPPPPPDRNGGGRPVCLGVWEADFPALCEFLSELAWEPGVPRVPGSLTMFVDDSQWKLCLNDKDAGRVAFVTAPTPLEALEKADRGLHEGTLDWRVSYVAKQAKKKNSS